MKLRQIQHQARNRSHSVRTSANIHAMPPKRKVAQVYDSTAYPSGSSTSGNNYSQRPPSPAPKRSRKTKADSGVAAEEKRLARFKPNCPKVTLDRVERVLQQRSALHIYNYFIRKFILGT